MKHQILANLKAAQGPTTMDWKRSPKMDPGITSTDQLWDPALYIFVLMEVENPTLSTITNERKIDQAKYIHQHNHHRFKRFKQK